VFQLEHLWKTLMAKIVDHKLTTARYGGHGHAMGVQGGYKMPPNQSHLQSGAKLPQSIESDGSGSANFNDPSTADYGTVDKG
jgi:hypothetical protein